MNGPDNLLDPAIRSAPLPTVRNHTALPSQYYQMVDVDDEVFHVVVVRSTYDMFRAEPSGQLLLAGEQTALVEADAFYGEPNTSSLIQESDYAPFKPRCDVLFAHAEACAPGGQPAPRIAVGVRVGGWEKTLQASGPRFLERGVLGWRLSEPESVARVPIRYEQAWGGTCQWPLPSVPGAEPERLLRDERNPIGCGFVDPAWLKMSRVADVDAPQLEVLGQAFAARDADAQTYPVIGLGAMGRWWLPRRRKAGTYDATWKQTRWPRLPVDFDFGYWNGAPEDQQIDYPAGGEQVVMIGLHPGGEMRFCLPAPPATLLLHLSAGVPMFKRMNIDTLLFDLKAMQLIVVQRGLVAAAAGVDAIEIGTWDITAAQARNAALLPRRASSPA